MVLSDKTLGIIGLCLGLLCLSYLLLKLIILPILPLDNGHILTPDTSVTLLLILGTTGFIFVGSLSIYTLYVLYTSNINLKRIRDDRKFIHS